jgi:glutaredoxin
VYGAQWCGDCRRSLALLDRLGVDYEYIDLVREPDRIEEAVRLGKSRRIPVILTPSGEVLVEPSDPDLESALTGT